MIFDYSKKKLKAAHITAEVSPYSKIGGLGDVGYALPKALSRLGHEVIIITPYYGRVRKMNLEKETLDFQQSIDIDGVQYRVNYRKHFSPDGIPIYFIVNDELFGSQKIYDAYDEDEAVRWLFFNRAAIELLRAIDFRAEIIHTHDWTAGLVPNYLKFRYRDDEFFKNSATVYTIHNLHYQGAPKMKKSPEDKKDKGTGGVPEQKNYRNHINFMKRGIVNAHVINTVSERYAKEILTPKFGVGLDPYLKRRKDRVFGIINGIDYEVWNPAFDSNLQINYDVNSLDKKLQNKTSLQKEIGLAPQPKTPLIGMVNRLSEQKGFKLIMEAMPTLLKMDLQMVIVGSGSRDYLKFFREIARKHRTKIGVSSPFTEQMASKVYAGSDLYLMPSRWEPCGISQLISLRYGSIPIVHSVGGLHDTITDFDPEQNLGNGFKFETYTKDDLLVAIARAAESYKYKNSWNKLTYRAMKQSFSWELPAKKYTQLYHIALKIRSTS
jgi:starch synthase